MYFRISKAFTVPVIFTLVLSTYDVGDFTFISFNNLTNLQDKSLFCEQGNKFPENLRLGLNHTVIQ